MALMGCLGMAKREDERQAAARSLSGRPLTTPAVEAHLAGFGLSREEACHRRLGALSSGQRARAVLGASTWLAPHLLVLDVGALSLVITCMWRSPRTTWTNQPWRPWPPASRPRKSSRAWGCARGLVEASWSSATQPPSWMRRDLIRSLNQHLKVCTERWMMQQGVLRREVGTLDCMKRGVGLIRGLW